ncbi:MAG: putative O-glycosylation ligase, exosortase A system-associated [Deltaproteobacteria bacterium]|nr:putative O-glycosylation ligase, exosortase A system-associated [Deltaproteobacteria bacterium]
MPLRDLVIIPLFFCLAVLALQRPIYGLYGWYLVSFMNIHRLGWGYARTMQPALLMAVTTLVGVMLHPKPGFKLTRESSLVLVFWVFTLLTTLFAAYPAAAWQTWINFSKTLLFFFLTIYLIDNYDELKRLVMATTFFLGFYGIKGGIFSLVTGGRHRVYGPEESFIADNNEMALALNMTLPMIWWLAQNAKSFRAKQGWIAMFGLSVIAIIFTFSRGGFLTLILIALLLFKNSRKKFLVISVAGVILLVLSFYIGEHWTGRMESIGEYQQESSAMSRITAWGVAWNFALEHPLFGGGFKVMSPEIYWRYGVQSGIVSHSIYFGTLAEHGFLGLVIYLLIYGSTLSSISRIRKMTSDANVADLLRMIKLSLWAFLFGGAFYEMQYFDYALYLVSVVSAMRIIAEKEFLAMRRSQREAIPAWRPAGISSRPAFGRPPYVVGTKPLR